jgi:transposase-like protein
MGQLKLAETDFLPEIEHPRCPQCRIPMWHVRVAKSFDGQRVHFECVVCGAETVVPQLN